MAFNPLSILGWITGLPIAQISNDIKSVQIAKLQADGDTRKQELQSQQAELEAQRDVYIAMAGNRFATLFAIFLSLPAAFYIWQLIVFDKMIAPWFGGHATDDLSANLWWYVIAVVSFWLGHRIVGQFKK